MRGNLPAGTRVTAPHAKRGGIYSGVIVDNLSVMYYIRFDCGRHDFVFKAEQVRPEAVTT